MQARIHHKTKTLHHTKHCQPKLRCLYGIGRTSSTQGVATRKFPHASQELNETADEDGHADNDVGCVHTVRVHIDEGENECGRREREQTAIFVVIESRIESIQNKREEFAISWPFSNGKGPKKRRTEDQGSQTS